MPVYNHEAMDTIHGVQQGLEASMARHKDELSQKFGARLAHACREAEDAAVERSQAFSEHRVAALEEQLQAHILQWRATANDTLSRLIKLTEEHARVENDYMSLNMHLHVTRDWLTDLSEQVSAEKQQRVDDVSGLAARASELDASLAKESRAREGCVSDLSQRLEVAKQQASTATQEACKSADERFSQAHEDLVNLEHKVLQCLDDQDLDCLRQAKQHTEVVADHLRRELEQAKAAEQQRECEGREQAQTSIEASMASLRSEQAAAAVKVLASADSHAEQKLELLAEQFRDKLERSQQEAGKLTGDATSAIWDAIASLEGRVADAKTVCAAELRSLADGETLRLHFLNALKVRNGEPSFAQGGQMRAIDTELLNTNAHVRRSLEASLQDEVMEIREALADTDARLCQTTDKLQAELSVRVKSHEIYTRLQAGIHEVSSRCCSAHGQASEAQQLAQQELRKAFEEIATLRSATTSLTEGVLKALQIIGILDEATQWAVVGDGHALFNPGQTRRNCVNIEDLLQWDKAGNSLSARISRQWQRREAAGNPTLLAALDRLSLAEARKPVSFPMSSPRTPRPMELPKLEMTEPPSVSQAKVALPGALPPYLRPLRR